MIEIKLSILFILALSIVTSFAVLNTYYRRFYKRMKTAHKDEFQKLINKDRFIEDLGEWVRWPFGSVYLISSVFKINTDYNDEILGNYKRKVFFAAIFFCISFVLLLLTAALLPK